MGVVVDFDGAEARPVELQRVAEREAVGCDDEAGDAPVPEDRAEALVGELGLAEPEVVEGEAQFAGPRFRARVELRVGGDFFPAPPGFPIGDIRDGGRIASGFVLRTIGDERPHHGVGHVSQFFGQRAYPRFGGFRDSRVVAHRQGNGGDMHAGNAGYVGERGPARSIHAHELRDVMAGFLKLVVAVHGSRGHVGWKEGGQRPLTGRVLIVRRPWSRPDIRPALTAARAFCRPRHTRSP